MPSGSLLINTQLAPKPSNNLCAVAEEEPFAQSIATFIPLKSLTEAMGPDKGQMEHPCKNDLRTKLIYLLYKMFGVRGPKFLFMLDQLRMR